MPFKWKYKTLWNSKAMKICIHNASGDEDIHKFSTCERCVHCMYTQRQRIIRAIVFVRREAMH